ncbi:MAG: tRNA pseudouridine(38-40) synthase TruA [Caldilineaceae bacterium]|nr:tRNA pseudouridine(38-40) synthase TruA [Caldilineaceae bacterium]
MQAPYQEGALNVAAVVTYDGTDYHGFQVQAGVPTIQGALENALARFCEPLGRVAGAGRTDAGVHACGQVVAVQLRWRHSLEKLQSAWNAHLPPAITVHGVTVAPVGFHPRFSAQQRTYRYSVVEGNQATLGRSPLTDRFALYVSHPLDVGAMQAATKLMVGEHDFATFGLPTQGESTIRRVMDADWQVVTESLPSLEASPPKRLVLTITANGFLRNMVRCLVGTFLAVGRSEWSLAAVADALAARDRSRTAPPASPKGLLLAQVVYPDHLDPWSRNR